MQKGFSSLKSKLGNHGEELVSEWLHNQGFHVKERNYRKRFGEVDLIATKGNVIAFIEVKTRKANYFNLSEVITQSKQKKIILTAKYYIAVNNCEDRVIRFDVALVEKKENNFEIKYIPNAFTEDFY